MNSKSKRVEELEEKLFRLSLELKDAKKKEQEIRRKQDTRRKIVMGGIFMQEIASGNHEMEKIFIARLKNSLPKTQAVFPEYADQFNEKA